MTEVAVLHSSAIVGFAARADWDVGAAMRRLLDAGTPMLLTEAVIADTVTALERGYRADRHVISTVLRSLLAHESVHVLDTDLLLRAVDLYEITGERFVDALVIATAETTGAATICSAEPRLAVWRPPTPLRGSAP